MASSSSSSSRKRKRKRERRKEKRKRKKQKKEEKRRKKEKTRETSNDDEVIDFSVAEAKHSLGLDTTIDVNEVDNTVSREYLDFKKKYKKAAKKLKKKLEPELTCSLCLDVLTQPVTASCGHSYCRVCLCRAMAKMTDEFNRFSCPQCRKRLCVKCLKRFAVNKSLSTVLETLFKKSKPTDNEYARFQVALKELKGEMEGIVRPSVVRTEEFAVMKGVTCTRTIITDPSDPVMRMTLGLSQDFEKCFTSNSFSEFGVYFLQLEEDEDDQPRRMIKSGFPFIFAEPSIYQKHDFEKNIFVKYRTEEDETEMTVGALNGRSIFRDIFIHPDSTYVKIRIAVPEFPELYAELSIVLEEIDQIYRREVFAPLNQNFLIGAFDEVASFLDEDVLSDATFESANEEFIDNDDTMGSFIVDDDDEEPFSEVESEPVRHGRRIVRRV